MVLEVRNPSFCFDLVKRPLSLYLLRVEAFLAKDVSAASFGVIQLAPSPGPQIVVM